MRFRIVATTTTTWGLPGGNVEEGEEQLQAAMREATEEMGHTPEHRIIREIITK